jgi:glyoxylase-like metal-dependent hydrolase (beta-lactamase superfamily II)
MTTVAKNIAKETGGTLDVVVATHQHTDHLSGFKQARTEFTAMKMKRLWLAWTEEKGSPLAKQIQDSGTRARETAPRIHDCATKPQNRACEPDAKAILAEPRSAQ